MCAEIRLERALEKVLTDRSPRDELEVLSEAQLRMLQAAQLIRGSRDQAPRQEFIERLAERVLPLVIMLRAE